MILRRVATRTYACEHRTGGELSNCPEFSIVELEDAGKRTKFCHRHAVERIDQLHAAALVLVGGFANRPLVAAALEPKS